MTAGAALRQNGTAALIDSQRRVLERIATGAPLAETFETLIRLIEEQADGMRCAVLLADPQQQRLAYVAAPSIPEDYQAGVAPLLRIGPDTGPCGIAAFLREPVYTQDTETDPHWKNWRDVAVRNGLRAIWSTPILADDNTVLGTFAMHYGEPRLPTPGHIQLIDMAVQMARVAIEAKRKEEDLQRSEDRLRVVIDTIPTMAWSVLPDGTVDFVNRPWLDYTGLSLEQGLKEPINNVHPEDRSGAMERWFANMAVGQSYEQELRLRRGDGAYHWFLIRTVPLRDESGNIIKWYGTATDIEDRKRADSALRQSEDHLRRVIDTIPAIVWSASADGTVDFVNDRWLEYTGLSREDALGWRWEQIVHPDDLARVTDYWRAVLLAGETGEIHLRLRRFDGEYRWFLARHVPVRDDSGSIVRWYGTCTDIQDHKQAESTLRRNQAFFVAEAQRISRLLEAAGAVSPPEHSPGPEVAAADEPIGAERLPAGTGRAEKTAPPERRLGLERQALESLTPNERAIMRLITDGKSNAEVGTALRLSPRTVETYRSRLMQKLQLEDLAGLVKFAIRHGIASVE